MRFGIDTLAIGALTVSMVWALAIQGPDVERSPYPLPSPTQASEVRWDAQAEKAFGLDEGTGVQAMTEPEWRAHQQKMSAMKPGERKRYQKEVRQQIVERIKTGRAPVGGHTAIRG
jgi:hypothetical protein